MMMSDRRLLVRSDTMRIEIDDETKCYFLYDCIEKHWYTIHSVKQLPNMIKIVFRREIKKIKGETKGAKIKRIGLEREAINVLDTNFE